MSPKHRGDDSNPSRAVLLREGNMALVKMIADEAATNAVKKTFLAMGLDPDRPIEAQRGFSLLRDLSSPSELSSDLKLVRRLRIHLEGPLGKIGLATLASAALAGVHLAWVGAKTVAVIALNTATGR